MASRKAKPSPPVRERVRVRGLVGARQCRAPTAVSNSAKAVHNQGRGDPPGRPYSSGSRRRTSYVWLLSGATHGSPPTGWMVFISLSPQGERVRVWGSKHWRARLLPSRQSAKADFVYLGTTLVGLFALC
jgi:hypothetical protein